MLGLPPLTNASAHLDKLFRAKLVAVEVQGCHHYYRLAGSQVAQALESLSILAPHAERLAESLSDAAKILRGARLCYDHLAGKLGVGLTRALCEHGYLSEGDDGYVVERPGWGWLDTLGIKAEEVRALRRPLTRRCLDWSERRYHLAGALGAALAARFLELRWISRVRESRAVRLSEQGRAALQRELAIS
jgi:DNA-binding transcriptional ArsR family regulator